MGHHSIDVFNPPAPSLSQLTLQTGKVINEVQFQYFYLHLNSIGIRETKKEKKLLTNNYHTKLLKFCCSGHWDINHPTINSPFGDSF